MCQPKIRHYFYDGTSGSSSAPVSNEQEVLGHLASCEKLAHSEYFGVIQSRLYCNSYDPSRIKQDFRVGAIPGSVARDLVRELRKQANVFNLSSYACE